MTYLGLRIDHRLTWSPLPSCPLYEPPKRSRLSAGSCAGAGAAHHGWPCGYTRGLLRRCTPMHCRSSSSRHIVKRSWSANTGWLCDASWASHVSHRLRHLWRRRRSGPCRSSCYDRDCITLTACTGRPGEQPSLRGYGGGRPPGWGSFVLCMRRLCLSTLVQCSPHHLTSYPWRSTSSWTT